MQDLRNLLQFHPTTSIFQNPRKKAIRNLHSWLIRARLQQPIAVSLHQNRNLKGVLARETGLEPKEQKLLFRGKEKDDDEFLHMVSVKDMSKVVLMEDAASKERKLKEMKRDQVISGALNSVALVKAEVDKLSQKVSSLEVIMHGGTKVAEKEFVVLTELFMVQLLNLDSIDAEGEAKVQRRSEVVNFLQVVVAFPFLAYRVPFQASSCHQWVIELCDFASTDIGI
ncbi:BAG family molecular chaperone regulator 4-like isoform X1 [Magnolia sinica]|uniref:BAG family molecular chaperone regulator 4-like isoform X1 n=1 Tax=Magnolia sinica TaxID=86752 RepID=UPI00265A6E21|nr:BAG family molecular chaperone regulator 4-like isoform X1 [Magnolia sinica]